MRPTQTSLFGDITQDSPKTEDAEAQYRIQTSIIGGPPTHSPKTAVTDPENRTLTSFFDEIIEDSLRSAAIYSSESSSLSFAADRDFLDPRAEMIRMASPASFVCTA